MNKYLDYFIIVALSCCIGFTFLGFTLIGLYFVIWYSSLIFAVVFLSTEDFQMLWKRVSAASRGVG